MNLELKEMSELDIYNKQQLKISLKSMRLVKIALGEGRYKNRTLGHPDTLKRSGEKEPQRNLG